MYWWGPALTPPRNQPVLLRPRNACGGNGATKQYEAYSTSKCMARPVAGRLLRNKFSEKWRGREAELLLTGMPVTIPRRRLSPRSRPNLALLKSVSNPTPNVGDAVIFAVTLSNAGPNPATNDRDGLRDELLNGEVLYTFKEAQIIIKSWRRHCNTIRPHALLGLQTTCTGGLGARARCVAACAAASISAAGHAGAAECIQLAFNPDHSMKAGQQGPVGLAANCIYNEGAPMLMVSQTATDTANEKFWNELCGTHLANTLGITDSSPASLKKFDDWYMDFYPYLYDHIPLRDLAGKDVLEIGLGYGTVSQLLAESGAHYSGLDIAAGPVAMSNKRLQRLGCPQAATQGSILNAPFVDASFDFIVAIGCLHHTGNLQRAIDECNRLLRPGGRLIFMVYNAYSYRRFVRARRETVRYTHRSP